MVDATWIRWVAWRDKQARADEDNPDDCIPYMECECPERGKESE